jgi:hypothetical protein
MLVPLTTLVSGMLSIASAAGRDDDGGARTLLFAYPLFWLMSQPREVSIDWADGLRRLLGVSRPHRRRGGGVPAPVRCSAMSVAYNVGQAIFGGTTPMVATY